MTTFNGTLETTFHSTSEIWQQTKCRMAMAKRVDNKIKTLHTLFMCRDFFNDTIYWEAARIHNGVKYGFKHNPILNPLEQNKTTILFDLDETGLTPSEFIESASGLMTLLEEDLDIEKTQFTEIAGKNTKKAVLIEGDSVWQKCAPLISVYTCFLRFACRKPIKSWKNWKKMVKEEKTNEAIYLASHTPEKAYDLFRSAPKWKSVEIPGHAGWKPGSSIDYIHNMGFQNFLNGIVNPKETVYRPHCLLHAIYENMQ
ncbi:MAG: hypothetical protein MN733_27500 [Nitrososphaera sp.]|nr:hypothetical protein [Nitrososphaera sp.]